MDGLLINTEPLYIIRDEIIFKQYQVDYNIDYHLRQIELRFEESFKLLANILNSTGMTVSSDEIKLLREKYQPDFTDIALMPGAKELFDEKINNNKDQNIVNLIKNFSLIICGDDNCVKEFGKYDVLIEKANLDLKDCVVLEDFLQGAKLALKSNLL
ncbi:11677_t:CDS:2, partial [Racocetra persica]